MEIDLNLSFYLTHLHNHVCSESWYLQTYLVQVLDDLKKALRFLEVYVQGYSLLFHIYLKF